MGKSSNFYLFIILILVGCGRDQTSVTASPQIRDSFGAVSTTGSENQSDSLSANKYNLVLQKSALEKEFLLNASLISQDGMNTSHGLQSRIIAFRQRDNKVYLLEASQGHRISDDLPQTLVRAEIPILEDKGDSLVLDFNTGMRQVFLKSGLYTSDSSGRDVKEDYAAVTVRTSFIQSIDFQNQTIQISQVVQADLSANQALPNFEIRYYISPYIKNPNFVSKENADKTPHFFEVSPQYRSDGTGLSDTFITARDLKKPITYYISANTPKDYIQTIKEGVYYWNQVLGKDFIHAEVAPQGVTAPNFQYDIIQWVPDDAAGSAYADMLTDPRSGEILHAQIYLTSVFVNGVKMQLPTLQRKLKNQNGDKFSLEISNLLYPAEICNFNEDDEAIGDLSDAKLAGATSAQLEGLIKDYLRHVVSHEVGHTLGLRHNFAGSLGSEVSVKDKNKIYLGYALQGVKPDQKIYTSSVMDYLTFSERVLTGVQEQTQILPYDRQMMEWGYLNKTIPNDSPLFCTDTQLGKFLDCLVTDSGKDPVVSAHTDMKSGLTAIPVLFAESFIHAKAAKDPRDRISLDKVNIDPGQLLETAGMFFTHLAQWLAPVTPSLTVNQMFPFIGPLNTDQVETKKQEWVQRQVTEVGGVDQLIFALLPATDHAGYDFNGIGNKALEDYLNRSYVQSGTAEDGSSYSLSQDDIKLILGQGKTFFTQTEKSFMKSALQVLGMTKYQTTETPLSLEIENRLGSLAEEIILSQPSFGTFTYSIELRLLAVKVLDKKLGKALDWNQDNANRIKDKLVDVINKIMGKPMAEVKLTDLSRVNREWFMEQSQVVDALSPMTR